MDLVVGCAARRPEGIQGKVAHGWPRSMSPDFLKEWFNRGDDVLSLGREVQRARSHEKFKLWATAAGVDWLLALS